MNHSDDSSTPTSEYFVDHKLDLWQKYFQIFQDAHDKVSEKVLDGFETDINKHAIKKIAGKLQIKVSC